MSSEERRTLAISHGDLLELRRWNTPTIHNVGSRSLAVIAAATQFTLVTTSYSFEARFQTVGCGNLRKGRRLSTGAV